MGFLVSTPSGLRQWETTASRSAAPTSGVQALTVEFTNLTTSKPWRAGRPLRDSLIQDPDFAGLDSAWRD